MTALVAIQRVSDADVQARFRRWVRDVFEPMRHSLKMHDAALGHAWSPRTAKAKWLGHARYDVADMATLAQHPEFGRPFVNHVLHLPPPDAPIPDDVRAEVAACLARVDELMRKP
jgi:hypothetical protein